MSKSVGWIGAARVVLVVLPVGVLALAILPLAVLTLAIPIAGCGPGAKATGLDAAVSDVGAQDGPVDATASPDTTAPTDAAPDAPRDVASEAPATPTPDSTCRASIETQCRRYVACRGADLDDCVNTVAHLCPDYYFSENSNRTVAGIQACLTALAQVTCSDLAMGISPSCLTVPGKGALGTPCVNSNECQFACNGPVFQSCGTCIQATRVDTGQACDTTRWCNTTDYCHFGTKTCAPKASIVYAAEDQACDYFATPSVGCAGDLLCARPSETVTAGTCRSRPKLGEPCVNDGSSLSVGICGPGLSCDAQMVCRPWSCGDVAACDANSFCRTLSGVASCVPYAAEGQPCRLLSPEVRCVAGMRCAMALDAGQDGICVKPGAAGDACREPVQPCGSNLNCVDNFCRPFDPAACRAGLVDAGGG